MPGAEVNVKEKGEACMAIAAVKRVQEFLSSQVHTWDGIRSSETLSGKELLVITLSMESGSGGSRNAREVAARLGYDHFHRNTEPRCGISFDMPRLISQGR